MKHFDRFEVDLFVSRSTCGEGMKLTRMQTSTTEENTSMDFLLGGVASKPRSGQECILDSTQARARTKPSVHRLLSTAHDIVEL